MPIVPLRELGKLGVITDVDPYDLPIQAFSFAKNVRFEDGRVERGSVFRKIYDLGSEPKFMTSYDDPQGIGHALYVNTVGAIVETGSSPGGADVTPVGWSTINPIVEVSVTSCQLQNIVYVNRSDDIPSYRSRNEAAPAKFVTIPTNDTTTEQWQSGWRCKALRAMNGVLVALNVEKGSSRYGSMVKWSNFVNEINTIPLDWNYASTTSNAGENTLAEMRGEIIDGALLRNRMFIYGTRETWVMDFVGGLDMFRFERAFDRSIINTNCAVENDGVHYVFGTDDLWIHDGSQDHSLATGTVRKFIFGSLKLEMKRHFFVTHNRRTNEIIFCYASDDSYCKFPARDAEGCNRAAIYNHSSKTWTFADLPYVTSASLVRPTVVGETFDAGTSGTFESAGGSFAAQALEMKENLAMVGVTAPNLPSALRSFEPFKEGASSYILDAEANGESYIIREGIDADELRAELRGYKLISSIYPQGRLDIDALPIVFEFGTNDHVEDAPAYGLPQTWDRTYYKLDFNQAGRYLAYRITHPDFKHFSFSGFDFDITILGAY